MTLFLKTIKINKIYNIFLIIQMIIFILFAKGEIYEIIEQKNINEYVQFENNIYYVSGCFDELDSAKKIMGYSDNVQKKYNIGVGYLLKDNAEIDNETVELIYLNDIMSKISYKLDSGAWLNDYNKSGVLLGYYWKGKYNIGDDIKVKIQGKVVTCIVQGFLQKNAMLNRLTTAGEQMDYQLMLEEISDKTIITNNELIVDNVSKSQSIIAAVVSGKYANVKEAFPNNKIISFDKIKDNSIKQMNNKLSSSGVYSLMFMLLLINSFILICIVAYKRNMEMYKIYYTLGMRKVKIFCLAIINMFFNCGIALGSIGLIEIIFIKDSNSEFHLTPYFQTNMFIILFMILGVFILYSLYIILMLRKLKTE